MSDKEDKAEPYIFKGMDVEIKFPFKPYKIQETYMRQMIRALNMGENALLESPTGTGKTLSILCSALAWLNKRIGEKKKEKRYQSDSDNDDLNNSNEIFGKNDQVNKEEDQQFPKIYFSSRTHSQLSQSIKELKKINFGNNYGIVLAGRDLLCINEDVQKLDNTAAKNQACKSKIGANCSCLFYKDVENKVKGLKQFQEQRVLDVEDLRTYGEKYSFCPYFASKSLEKKCEVIFLPYNYLLDPKIRKAQRIKFNDDIIIFDEGHNIEKTCEESVSVDLRSDHVACCIKEMQNIYKLYMDTLESIHSSVIDTATMDAVKEFTPDDLILLKTTLDDFEKFIDSKVEEVYPRDKTGSVLNDNWIFELLDKIDLSFDNIQMISEIIDKVLNFLVCILPIKGPTAVVASASLNNFKDFLNILKPNSIDDLSEFIKSFKAKFKVYLEIVEEKEKPVQPSNSQSSKKSTNKNSIQHWIKSGSSNNNHNDANNVIVRKWILHVWCLSPSVGLKGLIEQNVRSVVLTSGTLAPLDSFEPEFDTRFPVRVQNTHIINNSQMSIYPVSNSYNNVRLDSCFKNKDNKNYYKALGDTIVDICSSVPDGVLLFFSSYSVMNNSIKHWRDNDYDWKIWNQINRHKKVFIESKDRDEFNDQITSYRSEVDGRRGAIFFGICRGKMSEGIDLGDEYSRGVILVGLPFPAFMDPRVQLKRKYLDAVKYENYTSNTWYSLQMKRALNQAIGRAIRHKNDYGCVFLLDYRFVESNNIKDLSKWCREYVKYPANYRDMVVEVKKFFENKKKLNNQIVANCSIKEEVNINTGIGKLDLDFSLSEYTNKNGKKKSSKKRVFDSGLDEKSKKIKSDKANSIFEIIEVQSQASSTTSNENNNNRKVFKKNKRHISIEYDNNKPTTSANLNENSTTINDEDSKDLIILP